MCVCVCGGGGGGGRVRRTEDRSGLLVGSQTPIYIFAVFPGRLEGACCPWSDLKWE